MNIRARGQGALEYLLLIGGAVLISTIILLMVISSTSSTNGIITNNLGIFQHTLGVESGLGSGSGVPIMASQADIPYGTDPAQHMDWYNPIDYGFVPSDNSRWPIVIFVHGGGYTSGSENSLSPANEPWHTLLLNGYAIVSVQYRLSPAAFFPEQAIDTGRAIQYVRDHAAEFNIDTSKVIGYGISAGSTHLGYLAFGPDLLSSNPAPGYNSSSRPNVYVNSSGQMDFTAFDPAIDWTTNGAQVLYYFQPDNRPSVPTYQTIGDVPLSLLQDASPLYHLQQGGPILPVLSIYPNTIVGTPPLANVHDAYFGQELQNQLQARGASAGENVFYDSSSIPPEGVTASTVNWLNGVV